MSIFDPNSLYKRDTYDTRKGQVIQQKYSSVPGAIPPRVIQEAENWAQENGMIKPPGPWINANQIHYIPFTFNFEKNSPFQNLDIVEYIARSGITPFDIGSILNNKLMSYIESLISPGSYVQLSFEIIAQTFRRRCDNEQVTIQVPSSFLNFQDFIEGLTTLNTPQHIDHARLLLDQYMAVFPGNEPGNYPDTFSAKSTWNGTSRYVINSQYLFTLFATNNDAVNWIMNNFPVDSDPIIFASNVVGMSPKSDIEFWGLSTNVQIQGRLLIVNPPLV